MSEDDKKVTATIGAGDVPIVLLTLDGVPEDFVLRPTYAAAKAVSKGAGGFLNALNRVGQMDAEFIADVVALGLGYGQTRRPPPDLGERVYRTGVSDEGHPQPARPGETRQIGGLGERCVEYVRVLMNGGQPPKEDEGARDDTANPPKS